MQLSIDRLQAPEEVFSISTIQSDDVSLVNNNRAFIILNVLPDMPSPLSKFERFAVSLFDFVRYYLDLQAQGVFLFLELFVDCGLMLLFG